MNQHRFFNARAAATVIALTGLVAAGAVQAQAYISGAISVPGVSVGIGSAPVYVQPAPAYYPPPPAVVYRPAPPPVYYVERPYQRRYYRQPRAVYYYSSPVAVYAQPAPVYAQPQEVRPVPQVQPIQYQREQVETQPVPRTSGARADRN